jgi:hypothetical protein
VARWQLNDLALNNVQITTKKITTPWANATNSIYPYKAVVVNPNKLAQPISIQISLAGPTRFAVESSIRAELENYRTTYVQSNIGQYFYETKTFGWIVPQSFVVEDSDPGGSLHCRLNGFIDEKTIHSGNFTNGWAITPANSFTLVTDSRFGRYCIQTVIATQIKYTPPIALNLSDVKRIGVWISCDTPSSARTTATFSISDGTHTYAWNLSYAANTWTYQDFDITDSSGSSINLTAVTYVALNFAPYDASNHVRIGWIFID